MDGITLNAVALEISQTLKNQKIEKIHQPSKDELVIAMRNGSKLLISASTDNYRVQLTEVKRVNPIEAPMFCMLLRKLIGAGKILDITQQGLDRVLNIKISALDELARECFYTLSCEIMGKHSNIILIKEDGTVADSIKHITPAISSYRIVLPGSVYVAPPTQDKLDPLVATEATIGQALAYNNDMAKALQQRFAGLSPAMAREIVYFAVGEAKLYSELDVKVQVMCIGKIKQYFEKIARGEYNPTVIVNDYNEAIACLPVESVQYDEKHQIHPGSMSKALDSYFALRDNAERMRQKTATLARILQNNIERCCKKLAMQNELLCQNDKMEQWRMFGELLNANLYCIEKGAINAQVENYYNNNEKIIIPLDRTLSPIANSQKYYKKYAKAKTAAKLAIDQITKTQIELQYIEGQVHNLSNCTEEPEIAQIRQELVELGYVKPEKSAKRNAKPIKTTPLHYISSSGADIFVGKNNVQNDKLTHQIATADDMWLHVKGMAGSHVIVKGEFDEKTLLEAATLAAYYSKGKSGVKIPVDYTPKRFVKKPSGSPPGFVIYTTNKTVLISPEEDFIKSIKKA